MAAAALSIRHPWSQMGSCLPKGERREIWAHARTCAKPLLCLGLIEAWPFSFASFLLPVPSQTNPLAMVSSNHVSKESLVVEIMVERVRQARGRRRRHHRPFIIRRPAGERAWATHPEREYGTRACTSGADGRSPGLRSLQSPLTPDTWMDMEWKRMVDGN